jgi:hypothetical protein
MHGGLYNYSLFLLRLPAFPLADKVPLGVSLDVLFILSLSALPAAENWWELALRLTTCFANAAVYAMEQGNFDVVVFLLTILGLALLRRAPLAGYAVFLFAAACKFYPISLLILAGRESWRRRLALAAFLTLGGVAYLLAFGHGTATALHIIPAGSPYDYVFGATDLATGLPLLLYSPHWRLSLDATDYLAASNHLAVPILAAIGPDVMIGLLLLRSLFAGPRYAPALSTLPPARQLALLAGAALIALCFFAAQNIIYRAIFLLLTQPGLWRLAAVTQGRIRAEMVLLNAAVPVLLWEATIRTAAPTAGVWLFYALLWWWVVLKFCEIIVAFLRKESSFL